MLLFEINRDNEERSPELKLVEFDQNDHWPNVNSVYGGLPDGILLESVFLNIFSRRNSIFVVKKVATGKHLSFTEDSYVNDLP